MFSQPVKQETPKHPTMDSSFGMVQHLELLFKEHAATDILKSGFNDTLVRNITREMVKCLEVDFASKISYLYSF